MNEIEGVITATNQKDNKFGIKIGNNWYNGFGTIPEGWTKGITVKMQYQTIVKDGKIYYNVVLPKEKIKKQTTNTELTELIKTLAMPKITVSVEKTIQEKQYEPKKFAIFLTMNPTDMNPQKIKELMDMAQDEIDKRIIEIRPFTAGKVETKILLNKLGR